MRSPGPERAALPSPSSRNSHKTHGRQALKYGTQQCSGQQLGSARLCPQSEQRRRLWERCLRQIRHSILRAWVNGCTGTQPPVNGCAGTQPPGLRSICQSSACRNQWFRFYLRWAGGECNDTRCGMFCPRPVRVGVERGMRDGMMGAAGVLTWWTAMGDTGGSRGARVRVLRVATNRNRGVPTRHDPDPARPEASPSPPLPACIQTTQCGRAVLEADGLQVDPVAAHPLKHLAGATNP